MKNKLVLFLILFSSLVFTADKMLGQSPFSKTRDSTISRNSLAKTLAEYCIKPEIKTNQKIILETRSGTKQRLDSIQFYRWNEELNEYQIYRTNRKTYDELGNLLSVKAYFHYQNFPGSYFEKSDYIYDEQGNILEVKNYFWSGGLLGFEVDNKDVFTYNHMNQETSFEEHTWDQDSSEWRMFYQKITGYHPSGQMDSVVISQTDWVDRNWYPKTKFKSIFDETSHITDTYELNWDRDNERWDSIEWLKNEYNVNGLVKKTWIRRYYNGEWYLEGRMDYSFPISENGYNITEFKYSYPSESYFEYSHTEKRWKDNIPILDKFDKWNYDSLKFLPFYTDIGYTISGQLDSFITNDFYYGVLNRRTKDEYIHDSDYGFEDLILPKRRESTFYLFNEKLDASSDYNWDKTTNSWINIHHSKYFYSEVQFNKVNNDEDEKPLLFPNPSDGVIYIKDPDSELIAAEFFLYDSSGKRMLNQIIGPQKTIYVGNIPSGLYIYNLNNNGITLKGKIILK